MEKQKPEILTEDHQTLKLHYSKARYLRVQFGEYIPLRVKKVNVETLSDGSHNVQITLNVKNLIFTTDVFENDSN